MEQKPEVEAPQTARTPNPPAEKPPAPAGGVSLWHKIFGTPDLQAKKIAETSVEPAAPRRPEADRPREERQRERGGRRPEQDADRSVDRTDDTGSARELSTDSDAARADGAQHERADDQEENRKRRPRRRRGRGRGRRSEGEAADGKAADESRSESRPESRAKPASKARRDRPRRTDAPPREEIGRVHEDDVDDLFDEDDDAGAAGFDSDPMSAEESTGPGVPLSHRNIPTWDEAIGLIVDVNLQTRTERRRTAPRNSRGPGGPGGGSRGRRKKNS